MHKRVSLLSWRVVLLTKSGTAKRGGWYVLWTNARGARMKTYAGRTKALADSLLARKLSERTERSFRKVAEMALRAGVQPL